ncbi:hypothetical protein E2C01_090799 [Portunus trituberculatus]|uniref:Uncharacterized protein n=1 Tax=Portunus trituberculatus TaxID=210409 RepID=A0A5B7JCB6_PORTR|nr:hypothetical protein [Portunus trituberculatus]
MKKGTTSLTPEMRTYPINMKVVYHVEVEEAAEAEQEEEEVGIEAAGDGKNGGAFYSAACRNTTH